MKILDQPVEKKRPRPKTARHNDTAVEATESLDRRVLLAAIHAVADGDFSVTGTDRRVTLPLSMPGIIAGSMLVFIPAIGEFVIPTLLGGPDNLMIGRVLWDEFFGNRDWPVASAVAIVFLVLLVGPIALYQHYNTKQLEA
jgi:putrescine transport system permease protein